MKITSKLLLHSVTTAFYKYELKKHLCFFAFLFVAINSFCQPVINSVAPTSGPVGAGVTIMGSGLGSTPSGNTVFFGAVKANVTSAAAASITVQVPAGATYQPITVTSNNLTGYSEKPFLVTFPGGIIHPKSFSYASMIDSLENNHPRDFEIGDLDGDGLADVSLVDWENNTLSVYKNKSIGETFSFHPKLDYATGEGPTRLALGDIDGDGRLDIAVSNQKNNTVSIYKNTSSGGTISFASKVNFITGTQPHDLTFQDLDGDGKNDLAVVCLDLNGTVSILRNTTVSGTISFATKFDLTVGGMINNMATGRLDSDTKVDMVFTGSLANQIFVVKNNSTPGSFSFSAATSQSTGLFPSYLAVGDLDLDGKPDIAVSNFLGGTVSVYRNTSAGGTISLASKIDYSGIKSPDGIAIGDLDGDGKPDLAVTNSFEGIEVLKNASTSGTISFPNRQNYTSNAVAEKMAIADINNDGKADLAILAGYYRVMFWRNDATKPSIASFTPTIAAQGTTVTISGYKLNGATAVSFGGVAAASFSVVNSNTIAAVVGAGASGNISVTTPNGTTTLEGFTFGSPPTITSFTPTSGRSGTSVTITGTNLQNTNAVSFGGVPARSFTIISTTSVRAVVGDGQTGSVSVSSVGGTASLDGFTYTGATISSVNPLSGRAGDVITIQGTNLTGASLVSFGGTPASSFTVVNANTIQAQLGPGSTGDVSITTPNGVAIKPGFTYTGPTTVTSFTPTTAGPRTSITITGTNLKAVTGISFGGTPATSFTIISATTIEAIVGTGSSGNISLSTPSGTITMAGFIYTPPPTISSFNPTSGPAGTIVTIAGNNFDATAANNIVYTGIAKAQVLSSTTSQLTIKIPAGTNFDPISVTSNNLTATSQKPFIITFPGADTSFNDSSFASKTDLNTLSATSSSFFDLDGDGKLDLIESRKYEGKFSVARNTSANGNISFGPKLEFITGDSFNPPHVVITPDDLNGDGKPDLLVKFIAPHNSGTKIFIYKNISSPGVLAFENGINYVSIPPGPTISSTLDIFINDLNEDGKKDLILGNDIVAPFVLSYYQNTSKNGVISFGSKVDIYTEVAGRFSPALCITDFDGDKKPDIISMTNSSLGILDFRRNTTVNGIVSFAPKIELYTMEDDIHGLKTADLDGDDKPDLIASGFSSRKLVIYKNASTPGNFSLGTKSTHYVSTNLVDVIVSDLDGDNRPDLGVWVDFSRIALFKNKSTVGSILFSGNKQYIMGDFLNSFSLADLDGDSKPEIAFGYYNTNAISILRNRTGLYASITLCAGSNGTITSNLTGSSYQWQINSGSGFVNIQPGTNYSGINADKLQINSVTPSLTGYQYRCIVDGVTSNIYILTVNSTSLPSGDAFSPTKGCIGIPYNILFTSSNTPTGSSVQLWENINNGSFTSGSTQTYNGVALNFSVTSTSVGSKKYFFKITTPTGSSCVVSNNSDTSSTLIGQMTKPVISVTANTIIITNPDAGATYQWQMQDASNNWDNINPPVTGLSFNVTATGTYRVRSDKEQCTQYSDGQLVTLTNPNATSPNETVLLYPNPTHGILTLDSLKLSDNWEVLDIVSLQSGQTVASFNIINKTKITVHLEALSNGIYLAVLRRRDGSSISIEFVKM